MDRKICLTHKNMPPKVRVDIPHPLAQIFWYLSLSKELCSRKLKRMQNINIYVETEPSKYVLIRWEFIYSLDVVKGFSNSRISFQHTTAPLRMSKACDKNSKGNEEYKKLIYDFFYGSWCDHHLSGPVIDETWNPSSLCDLMRKENSTWKFQPFSCSHLH